MPKPAEAESRRHRRPPLIQRVSAALGRIGTLRPIRSHDHHGRGAGRTSITEAPPPKQSDNAHLVGARLAAIIKSSQDAIVGKDLSGIINDWNPAAERLFGYSAGEAIGSRIMMLLPAGREQEERDILDRISRGEVVEHFETQRRHKHGHLVDVQVTISPIRDGTGRVIGASESRRNSGSIVKIWRNW
jgi:PAS domain S-box-containing protein